MKNYFFLMLLFFTLESTAESMFKSQELGYKFTLGDGVFFDYNPHRMRKTQIQYKGRPVGGFTISVLPDGLSEEKYIEIGKKLSLSRYKDADIEVLTKTNISGLKYHDLKIYFSHKGENFIENKVILISPRDGLPDNEKINMMYTFHFLYQRSNTGEVARALSKMVYSFELLPNEGLYNYAIKQSLSKKKP